MKETTEEEVLKIMRHDNKRLDEALDELEELTADIKKASDLIGSAIVRYRKEKLKKKSLKAAAEEDEFTELADVTTRESIRDLYGWDMITENEMERLFYLWDLREEQKKKKKGEIYQDGVTKLLDTALNAMEDKIRDRKEELEEIQYKALAEARRRAQVINESRNGFLNI